MGTVGLAPGLSRKLKKVLELRTDSSDLVASLDALSSFYTENTPQTRRNLRSTIEKRSLQTNLDFLEASRAAQLALDRVEVEVNALAECCDTMAKALSSSSTSIGDVISTTERLKQELEITAQRQTIVSCFLRDYQLSSDELHSLRDEELNENFFKALVHVHQIHSNCKVLLRTHHQRAGLELMDMMAVYQEGAYERLCRWVQAECRKLSDSDSPEVGALLKTAVHHLKERPVLFKYCTEEVANIRHNVLFRRFISALTRGGPGGLPRPIEVHAHDPLRYVGDMLGWLHQALASERDFLLLLLDTDSTVDNQSDAIKVIDNVENGNGTMTSDLIFVLDRIFEGVCRPFKIRVEQVLMSLPNLIIAYKLNNTIEFYYHTILDLLERGSTLLCNTLDYLRDASQKAIFDNLKSRGEKLLRYPSVVTADLSPPEAVREGVAVLHEIISSYNSMMIPECSEKLPIDLVIAAILDPIVQLCEQAAEAHMSKGGGSLRKRLSSEGSQMNKSSFDYLALSGNTAPSNQTADASCRIFLINCLCSIQQPLLGYDFASDYAKKLEKMIDMQTHALVKQEVDSLLWRCGLSDKMDRFRECVNNVNGDAVPLATVEDTSPAALSESLKIFFGLILGNDNSLPEFEQIEVPKLRSEAGAMVATALAQAYDLIYEVIMDAKNGYTEPRLLARHPPHHIRTILGL